MRKLSTGQDSTLGNYRDLSAAFFGEDSPQVKFLDERSLMTRTVETAKSSPTKVR